MKILGIIPARGGSKGIPRKNLASLRGKPLLAYTAEAALSATMLDRVILSTDDKEIADLGNALGLEVPFLRPKELARDDTPTVDVVRHAVQWPSLREGGFQAVCLLQPTAPLRTAKMIDEACQKYVREGIDTLVSVLPIPHHHHPDWALVSNSNGSLRWANGQIQPPPRRQELCPAFQREGSIYITRMGVIEGNNSLYGQSILGYEIDLKDHVNIDSVDDLRRAEQLLEKREVCSANSEPEECPRSMK